MFNNDACLSLILNLILWFACKLFTSFFICVILWLKGICFFYMESH